MTTSLSPGRTESPTRLLLTALRAGVPLEVAADAVGLPRTVAQSVAGSPLARALLAKPA